jgi:hypothetical protein
MKKYKSVLALLTLAVLALALVSACAEQTPIQTALSGGAQTPYDKIGLTMFPGNRTSGSLSSQMSDIRTLKVKWIRATFWFDTSYMPASGATPNFARFDEIVDTAEAAGLDVLPILAYVPNWLVGNPDWKTVFVNDYVIPVVTRYKGRVKNWEVWNEPDEFRYNVLNGSADDYFDLLKRVSAAIRRIDPSAKVVSASTANITADGVAKWEWLTRLINLGLPQYADVLNIHYYADQEIELSSIGGPTVQKAGMKVWVTETGKSGQGSQKSYFDSNMPYIDKSINPERIYWYCYVQGEGLNEEIAPNDTYGLITYYGGLRYESTLYTHLKTR